MPTASPIFVMNKKMQRSFSVVKLLDSSDSGEIHVSFDHAPFFHFLSKLLDKLEIVDSKTARQRTMTLETSFHKLCANGEGIRLQFLEGNAGALKATLRQIKAGTRAAMTGLGRDHFMMTFKSGDRFIIPCKANNPNFRGDENCYHTLMATDKLNELRERQMSLDRTAGVCWK